ncbi:transporter [Anaerococcus hydrogenalis]|uniref:Transporter n=2 Tax=Anaerococcus hydrogenalis TaxID=33029 RepID=A0A2N6UJB9_9FIRM|nr:transporter [Anaerococcus hydrogenalis]
MKRDEVLARSRQEYKDHDEMVVDIFKKAGEVSSQIGLAVAAILFGIEAFFFNSFNYGILSIYFSIEATKELVKYVKLKERKQLLMGILMAIIGIALFVANLITLK